MLGQINPLRTFQARSGGPFCYLLCMSKEPAPTDITLHTASRVLEITFDDGRSFRLPFEFLRVYSPSAEVRGHGPGQETLQVGKREVGITRLDPVGHYAIQPVFSDGHSSGIFSWRYLYEIGQAQERLWAEYLAQLEAAGASRDSDDPRNAAFMPAAPSCGSH
jgi:DUF971 family protein